MQLLNTVRPTSLSSYSIPLLTTPPSVLISEGDLAYQDDLTSPPSPTLEDLPIAGDSVIADEDAVNSEDILNAANAKPPSEFPYASSPTSRAPKAEEAEEGPTLSRRTSYSTFVTPSDITTNTPSTSTSALFNMDVLSEAIKTSLCTQRRSIRIPADFAGKAPVPESIPDVVVGYLDALHMDEESVDAVVSLFLASRNIIGFKSRMLAAGISEEESVPLWAFLKKECKSVTK